MLPELTPNTDSASLGLQDVLTRKEAAAYLRISDELLLDAILRKDLPVRHLGNRQLFSRRKLLDWVEAA